ncbi:MAG: DUF4145 domain-containing protein [Rhodospirillales bacterium]
MKPESWECMFCNRFAMITDNDIRQGTLHLHSETSEGRTFLFYRAVRCPNNNCHKVNLYVEYRIYPNDAPLKYSETLAKPIKQWQLLPESEAKPQPGCIPKAIREDYDEACLIKYKSPKASATLSRRCLQAMIRDFWGIKDKKNLAQEIEAIKGDIDPDTWNAIQAVRHFGNIGAHMEKDVNLILDIEPEEAGALIGLIEILFKDWYIAKEGRKNALKGIVEMAQQKKPQKKQSSADSAPPENEPE